MHGGRGLNVTLPFKQQAGAANTLWMQDKQLQADNTDGIGLVRDLARYIELAHQRVLVLGAGGAARGIIAPLLDVSIASLHPGHEQPETGQTG